MKKEITVGYIPEMDRTIIFETVYDGEEMVRESLIGWYFGKPNDEDTKTYANGKMYITF